MSYIPEAYQGAGGQGSGKIIDGESYTHGDPIHSKTVYFEKKFCWLWVETYKSKHLRNGFVWFNFAYFSEEGKAYKSSVDLVRAEFNHVRG